MDLLTQGLVGSAVAQSFAGPNAQGRAVWYGAVAGMAPDLHALIRSSADPLLNLDYHRHFSHSLAFIPVGATFVALLIWWLSRRRFDFREIWQACMLGYATHGLLDVCTSYGTHLLWPFALERVSWNLVSIVDPLFTLPLLVFVIAASRSKRQWLAWCASAWMLGFFVLGWWQHQRAMGAAEQVAQIRGHEPMRMTVKPSFANLVLWKAIYEFEGYYYVDAVRVGTRAHWYPGARVRKLDLSRDFPGLGPATQQAQDIERFRWFSDDYLSVMDQSPRVVDMRYSLVPNEVDPMWGIDIDTTQPDSHVVWWASRELTDIKRQEFLKMVLGPGGVPLIEQEVKR